MSARLWLRGAAVFAALLALGHMLGSPWTPAVGPSGRAVIGAMSSYRFNALGLDRTYWDFYEGFGWMLATYLIGHAILFWQLSGLEPARRLRPVVALLCAESIGFAVLGYKYLFWVPVALSAAIGLCLAAATVMMSDVHYCTRNT
ncbi:MAG TPA: hypothetical protein VHY75_04525 [Steroidobacteraceae bacterium]|jgi:hypothetical protein|nr:hypothetical protein [Steroidobacteraceae bacterium]